MTFKTIICSSVLCVFAVMCLISCGGSTETEPITISGTITYGNKAGPKASNVFIAIAKGGDISEINKYLQDTVVLVSAPSKGNKFYSIDLEHSSVTPGDHVMVLGIVDNDYDGNIPWATPGDHVGFYSNPETMAATYQLKPGKNDRVDILINRPVFSYTASVSGKIYGDYTGDVVMFAYCGDMASLDLSSILFDNIIAFTRISKGAAEVDYRMDVIPYGFNIPVYNVSLFALFDANGNSIADPGELIGYYSNAKDGMPELITVVEGGNPGYDITKTKALSGPSGDAVSFGGTMAYPDGYKSSQGAVFIIVSDSDDPNHILNHQAESVVWFEKLSPGAESFHIDLSGSGLGYGDDITVIAVWDREYENGFPQLSPGDYIGCYSDAVTKDLSLILAPGGNGNVDMALNRQVYPYEASISGKLTGEYTGDVVLVAYCGDITSLDVTAIDIDNIIAYSRISKEAAEVGYSMDILPYGFNVPVENVYLFAVYDANGNSMADPGEGVGFYTDNKNGLPGQITVVEGNNPGYDITKTKALEGPSGDAVSLGGKIFYPDAYSASEGAVFIIVSDSDDPNHILTHQAESVIWFEKLVPGEGIFYVDLSGAGPGYGDDVTVIALWDREYVNGFPQLSSGDHIGYYFDEHKEKLALTLVPSGNRNVDIHLNRPVYSFEKTLSGTISDDGGLTQNGLNYTGDVIVFAYSGDIDSMDFSAIDYDRIIGYRKMQKTDATPMDYQLTIFPFGQDLPIGKVTICALYDADGNGRPDPGDVIGYHANPQKMPEVITIDETLPEEGATDITMLLQVAEPSGETIRLTGAVEFGPDVPYDDDDTLFRDKPAFLVVAQAETMEELFVNSFNSVKYFKRLSHPPDDDELFFDVDLSSTGLKSGDKITPVLLWDRDYHGGYPAPSKRDYLGFYQDKTNYTVACTLEEGVNDITPEDPWYFEVNRKLWFDPPYDEVFLSCSIEKGFSNLNYGDTVIIVGVHKDGANVNQMNLDTDYVVFMDIFPVVEGTPVRNHYGALVGVEGGNAAPDEGGNLKVFKQMRCIPALNDDVVRVDGNGEFLRVNGVFIIAILDNNNNKRFDTGDTYGFYNMAGIGAMPTPITIEKGNTVLSPSIRFTLTR